MKRNGMSLIVGCGLAVLTGCGHVTSLTQRDQSVSSPVRADSLNLQWTSVGNWDSKSATVSVKNNSGTPVRIQFTAGAISGKIIYRDRLGNPIGEGQLGVAAVVTDVTIQSTAEWPIGLSDMPEGTESVILEVIYLNPSRERVTESVPVRFTR